MNNHSSDDQNGHSSAVSEVVKHAETSSLKSAGAQRKVYCNDQPRNKHQKFPPNGIHTCKYNLLTFLPKNLYEQFHRVAYIYFLLIIILNQIPALAVFGRTASIFPLAFVLIVTAIKDAYEDYRRRRSDRVENNRHCLIWDFHHNAYQLKTWKEIKVGHQVKLMAGDLLPADLVVLCTSEEGGRCYMDMHNLDGESALKARNALSDTQDMFGKDLPTADEQRANMRVPGYIACEPAHRDIYGFKGYYQPHDHEEEAPLPSPGRSTNLPIGPPNFLPRGGVLRNTKWLVGVVVYTGHQTKALLNSSGVRSKRSLLEKQMNIETLWLTVILIVLCTVSGIGNAWWQNVKVAESLIYLGWDDPGERSSSGSAGIIAFFSAIIVFQIIVPISLFISMELVRMGQAYLMMKDRQMYDPESETSMFCRALNINEDLGQIDYIFSDKTGTLTRNKMDFHRCCIRGREYPHSQEPDMVSQHKVDPDMQQALMAQDPLTMQFLLMMAVCHTVAPIPAQEPPHAVSYQAESPDELALVNAAAGYGWVLTSRTSRQIVVEVDGKSMHYDLLGVHEFDSTRKCMSVVVRCPDGQVQLLLKGADSQVLAIVKSEAEELSIPAEETLREYSSCGLRTLCAGYRTLSEQEFNEWDEAYRSASLSMVDRTAELAEVARKFEQDLTFLGVVGIEDKLQDGVEDALVKFKDAGIKVWMLTGDKLETAMSIATSCMLLDDSMTKVIISQTNRDEVGAALQEALATHLPHVDRGAPEKPEPTTALGKCWKRFACWGGQSTRRKPKKATPPDDQGGPTSSMALVISGASLLHALEKPMQADLFALSSNCKVVICCRMAPLQKASVVNMVKTRASAMTLAIGDGANDVSMIQMAHVGVGISGQEGRQAVLASDFSIAQFRFLARLLLVHGHWCYHRISTMVLYNFYRNAVFTLLLFWFYIFSGYSSSTSIDELNLIFYSLIFTSVPTIASGILDQEVSARTLSTDPPLYKRGPDQEVYNNLAFWATMLDTLWQSLCLFFIPLGALHNRPIGIWEFGTVQMFAVIITANLHLAMDIHNWTWIHHASVWLSIAAYVAWSLVYDGWGVLSSAIASVEGRYGVWYEIWSEADCWLTLLLTVVTSLLPRFLLKSVRQCFYPSPTRLARERETLARSLSIQQPKVWSHNSLIFRQVDPEDPDQIAHRSAERAATSAEFAVNGGDLLVPLNGLGSALDAGSEERTGMPLNASSGGDPELNVPLSQSASPTGSAGMRHSRSQQEMGPCNSPPYQAPRQEPDVSMPLGMKRRSSDPASMSGAGDYVPPTAGFVGASEASGSSRAAAPLGTAPLKPLPALQLVASPSSQDAHSEDEGSRFPAPLIFATQEPSYLAEFKRSTSHLAAVALLATDAESLNPVKESLGSPQLHRPLHLPPLNIGPNGPPMIAPSSSRSSLADSGIFESARDVGPDETPPRRQPTVFSAVSPNGSSLSLYEDALDIQDHRDSTPMRRGLSDAASAAEISSPFRGAGESGEGSLREVKQLAGRTPPRPVQMAQVATKAGSLSPTSESNTPAPAPELAFSPKEADSHNVLNDSATRQASDVLDLGEDGHWADADLFPQMAEEALKLAEDLAQSPSL